ncbi:MAG: glycoside hydrolase family 127 protein, partial [Phycisphaeraceae bacterium]|nr:glycoside hydrolase family 127 protein [Phycisphaeraceae bacterium]
ISADGTHYFYTNPLRRTLDHAMDTTDQQTREPYIPCFCCPPNLVRTIAKVSGWAYSLSENGVVVNLYGGNTLTTKLLDGSDIKLKQETQYPWDGAVKITMNACKDARFEMRLRIPEWAYGTSILVNGMDAGVAEKPGTYARIERFWKVGDVVTMDMPMGIKLIEGHPRIEEVRNQVAIKRGPVVYCVESPDLPKNAGILDVYLAGDSPLEATHQAGFLGGLTTIRGKVLLRRDKKEGMYRPVTKPSWETVETQFVPYYAWSNRGRSEMTVWMPIVWTR